MNLSDLPSPEALSRLSKTEKLELLTLLEEREKRVTQRRAKTEFLPFAHAVYPGFKEGPHHRVLAKVFEAVLRGEKKRVIINMPPRFGKSEATSYLLPAFFLGEYPDKKIIMATHTAGLSEDYGRRVRNLIQSQEYNAIFPETLVSSDQKAAGKWSTSKNGQYYAVGVGGALAGRGADLLLVDDAHSEQDVRTNSKATFDSCWAWFQTGPRQRLMPNGAICVLMCMTGDTPVMLPDGTEKPLRNIRPGDDVATYEDGRITTARIANWRSSGVDDIYTIQTRSGKILRANERHPFLVDFDGERTWVRLRDLKLGMSLVATRAAAAPRDHRPDRDSATHAKQKLRTIEKIPLRRITQWAITASGKVSSALRVANLPAVAACAIAATRSSVPSRNQHQKKTERGASSIATASLWNSMKRWSRSAATDAMCVGSSLLERTHALIGITSFASTTATTAAKSGVCFATTATSQLDTARLQKFSHSLLSTYDVVLDPIVGIAPSGREEVFDVEVERTENFIANGVVSHNTRWATDDLTGRLLEQAAITGEKWELIELPAILPSGKSLWPEQWSIEELEAKRDSMDAQYWNAQFQQNPTSEEGALIKREWWRVWPESKPPKCDYLIQSWDTAYNKTETADYSACTTWGVFEIDDEKTGTPVNHIMLLDAFKDRMGFPELKRVAKKHYDKWKPDSFIVEAKAAGTPLIYELRGMGIPVQEFTPSRGNDKTVRVNSVSDLFSSGFVWRPDTPWAKAVAEECAAFPNGKHDDYVDTTTQALLRFRRGGFIKLPSDYTDNTVQPFRGRRRGYYGWVANR